MCWFDDWVTLSSVRCKRKMTFHVIKYSFNWALFLGTQWKSVYNLLVHHIVIPKGFWLIANVHTSFYENHSVYLKVIRYLRRQKDKTLYQFLGLTLIFEKWRVYFVNLLMGEDCEEDISFGSQKIISTAQWCDHHVWKQAFCRAKNRHTYGIPPYISYVAVHHIRSTQFRSKQLRIGRKPRPLSQ